MPWTLRVVYPTVWKPQIFPRLIAASHSAVPGMRAERATIRFFPLQVTRRRKVASFLSRAVDSGPVDPCVSMLSPSLKFIAARFQVEDRRR